MPSPIVRCAGVSVIADLSSQGELVREPRTVERPIYTMPRGGSPFLPDTRIRQAEGDGAISVFLGKDLGLGPRCAMLEAV